MHWSLSVEQFCRNKQFAVVENPGFWYWTFTLKDIDGNVLAEIDRDWRGFGFEVVSLLFAKLLSCDSDKFFFFFFTFSRYLILRKFHILWKGTKICVLWVLLWSCIMVTAFLITVTWFSTIFSFNWLIWRTNWSYTILICCHNLVWNSFLLMLVNMLSVLGVLIQAPRLDLLEW